VLESRAAEKEHNLDILSQDSDTAVENIKTSLLGKKKGSMDKLEQSKMRLFDASIMSNASLHSSPS